MPQAVERLLRTLAPGNARVAARVKLAAEDPERYAKRFRARREECGVEDEKVDLWFELVDSLVCTNLACGIDWKFAAEDIAWNVRNVLSRKRLDAKKLFAFYDEDAHLGTKTIEFIELCGRAFSAHGLALIELDLDGDSYELTVVPWANVSKAQQLAKRIGGKIVSHAPRTPLPKPLPSAPKKVQGKFQAIKVKEPDERDFVQHPGFFTRTEKETTFLDCRTWPPKGTKLGGPRLQLVCDDDDHRRIVHRVFRPLVDGAYRPKCEGTLRVEQRGRRPVDLVEHLPLEFDLRGVGFIDDLVVLLPTDPTVRGGRTRRPLVWDGKRLAAAKGLPDAVPAKPTRKDKWPDFLRQGFARTGSGIDVLVWGSAGYVATGGRFRKVCSLEEVPTYWVFNTAPAPGDSFYYVRRLPGDRHRTATIRQVTLDRRGGTDREVGRIERVLNPAVAGPNGTMIIGCNRYMDPKAPVLVVFHPERAEWTEVPPSVLGVRKDDALDAYGFGKAKDGIHLWALDRERLIRVPWSLILSLPRK